MNKIQKARLSEVVEIARQAGLAVMAVRNEDEQLEVIRKSDASPVTKADLIADELIRDKLTLLEPWPVLSEEGFLPSFDDRKLWQRYWLVDPLDGTRSFIRGGNEFTINIALVELGRPVLGVVFAPALNICYAAAEGLGAFIVNENHWCQIFGSKLEKSSSEVLVLKSQRQSQGQYPRLVDVITQQGFHIKERDVGSSLKLCMLAAGQGDINPCFVPTFEWDTAAAQVVVEQAGGAVLMFKSMEKLLYNQKQSLLNPSFIAVADANFDWAGVVNSI